jgi:hypothetical protein
MSKTHRDDWCKRVCAVGRPCRYSHAKAILGAVLIKHRHGHRGAEAGCQCRRRQLRWNSHQRCGVGRSECTRRRCSRLTRQRLRRKFHIHKTTAALRSVRVVVQPAHVACSQSPHPQEDGVARAQPSAASERSQVSPHALHCWNYHSNGEPTTPARAHPWDAPTAG